MTILLHACDGELLPAVAIGAFAGIRSAERARLDWSDINIADGTIAVTKGKSKTGARRVITMQPNLRAWLGPYTGQTGPVYQGDVHAFLRHLLRTCKAAGIEYPNKGLRNSFCSYHADKFRDPKALAHDMGHTTPETSFEHYRSLVNPGERERY